MPRSHFVSLLVATSLAAATPATGQLDPTTLGGFRWRSVGPANFGGRTTDVVGIPSPSKTFYVATAAGGIWKTTNAGTTFRPVFDDQRVVAMGALAIAPSDTNQVWAGTGEQNARNTIEPGMGVYKSTNGGRSWTLMGLEKTQHIGRIIVHPANPNIVYVAALGAVWKSNPERGLYKTEDGGTTWKLIKFVSDSAGFIDVAMDPSNPNVLFASSYQLLRGPHFLTSGGKGSALWKTTDGGATWTEVKGGGLPETTKGRIGIAISRSNPKVVYTFVEADTLPNAKPAPGSTPQAKTGLYRSDDGGQTWTFMNDVVYRPFYYSQVRVDPKNPNRVYWSSSPLLYSDDGGKTGRSTGLNVHVDSHAIWIDPNDPEHFIVGNDGGIAQTWDRGGNYISSTQLPIGQFYAVSFDFAVPYNICGGAQDNGSWCGPSRRRAGPVTNAYWFTYAPGDGFWSAQDPADPRIVYGEVQNGTIFRRNIATNEVAVLSLTGSYRPRYRQYEDSIITVRGDTTRPETSHIKARVAELRTRQLQDSSVMSPRFNWETPFFLSPHNREVLYVGGNRVLKSVQRGDHLYSISGDLSKQNAKKIDVSMKTTGGITNDATGAETYGTIVALAESYVKPGFLYAGTDDGNVWYTPNDGAAWTQVDWKKFAGLPNNEVYVSRIEPSHFDTLTWYVSFDNHRTNDFAPYLYVTTDGGKTFKSIAATLPTGGPDYVHVIREDPYNRDLLFAGTSVGAYVSVDRGVHWQKFMASMPTVPVFDLKIHPRDRELIAATHGRSFFIVDIAPLEQMAGKTLAGVTLFEPKRAYQYTEAVRLEASIGGDGQAVYGAPSPPYGAEIAYRFAPGAAPGGPVSIAIQDASGDTIATLAGSGSVGLQRTFWGAFRGTRKLATLPPLGPTDLRDSIVRARKTVAVFDSLAKAGWDTAFVRVVRSFLLNANPQPPNFNCGPVGGAAGPGGSGGLGLSPDRPAEGGIVRNGNPYAGCTMAIAGTSIDVAKYQDVIRLVNRAIEGPSASSNVNIFASVPSSRGSVAFEAAAGDYLVSMTVAGKTYKQVLHVERVAPGEVRAAAP